MTEKQAEAIELESLFSRSLERFLEELIEIEDELSEFRLAHFALTSGKIMPLDIASGFILYVLPHQNKIKKRDEQFFLEDKGLFTVLVSDLKQCVDNIKEFSYTLEKEDKDVIFQWVEHLLDLALKLREVHPYFQE